MSELFHCGVFQLQSEFACDDLTSGKDCDIAEHLLASVAEARRLYADAGESAAQLIENERRERFALDILGDNHELLTGLDDLFEQGEKILNVGNFLVRDEDERVVDDSLHFIRIGCHIRGDITAVELHALDDLAVGFRRFGFLDRDNAVCRDLFHCVRDQLADHLVAGGNGADSCDVVGAVDFLGILDKAFHRFVNRLGDAFSEHHRIGACGDVFHALMNESLREKRCGRGTVARRIVCLGGDFLDELRAHIFRRVLKLDFLGDGDAVVCNQRSAVFFVENDVSAFRSHCDFYRIRELIHSAEKGVSGFHAVYDILCHDENPPYKSLFNNCKNVVLRDDDIFRTVDFDFRAGIFAGDDAVSDLYGHRNGLAVLFRAGTYRNHFRDLRLFFCGSGENDTAFGGLFRFDHLYHNAVCQGFQFHDVNPPF